MPTYDWPLIQQRSGDSIESLVATLLRREYPDARQVNPSQGDGGIDILRPADDGLEIWQGKQLIARYHLVTPWTPTEERIAQFEELSCARKGSRREDRLRRTADRLSAQTTLTPAVGCGTLSGRPRWRLRSVRLRILVDSRGRSARLDVVVGGWWTRRRPPVRRLLHVSPPG